MNGNHCSAFRVVRALSPGRLSGAFNEAPDPMRGAVNMRKIFTTTAGVVVSTLTLTLAALPAAAISTDLAKKCRDMAIKAHPPEPAGTKGYAQAERDFYAVCISKNGEMTIRGPQKGQSPDQ